MTAGHYPDRVLLMLAFAACLFVAVYFCNKTGIIPHPMGPIRRDENPRTFAIALRATLVVAGGGAAWAIAIYFGYGLDLISN